MSLSFKKTLAAAKLTHIEKYGFAYEEDLNLIRDFLDAQIEYLSGNKVKITCRGNTCEAAIRKAGELRKNNYTPGTTIEI